MNHNGLRKVATVAAVLVGTAVAMSWAQSPDDADEHGCWQTAERCVAITTEWRGSDGSFVSRGTNNCGGDIYARFCNEWEEGNSCGAGRIRDGAQQSWRTYRSRDYGNPTGRTDWQWVGSTRFVNNWVCAGKVENWHEPPDYGAAASQSAGTLEVGDHAEHAVTRWGQSPEDADEDGCWQPPEGCVETSVSLSGERRLRSRVTNNCAGDVYVRFCSEAPEYTLRGFDGEYCAEGYIRAGEWSGWTVEKEFKPTGRTEWKWVGLNSYENELVCADKVQGWNDPPTWDDPD